jgi:dipeptidyl aminopeptidase/acylaminoacyl peptidase
MSRASLPFLVAAFILGAAPVRAQAPATPPPIVPNENLVVEGIPSLPGTLAEKAGRYTESRSASFLSWHPSRREMLIATRFGDTSQVHRLTMPGGARTQLTFFPDRVLRASYPRGKDGFFVFAKDVGGGEFFQLHRYDLATGDVTLLTDGGRSQNDPGEWSHTGDRLAYASTRRNGTDRDLYVVDPADPKSDRKVLEVQGGGWGVLDWAPGDDRLLADEFLSVHESYLHLVDVASGRRTALTPRAGARRVSYGGGEFSPDGRAVYTTTDRDSEFQRLARIDVATGRHAYLTADIPRDVDKFDLSPDGRLLAFVTNEDGVSVLRLMDAATGRERPAPPLPVGTIGAMGWHANSRDLAFSLSTARAPSDVYTLDAETGKLERWTESETGGIGTGAFADAEVVRWKSFDGRTISGLLYKPPARFTGRRPVIVNVHGGPEGQSRPAWLGRSNYFLNELGIAILFPNVRGSSGYGKTFLELDNGMRREDSVKDVGALLDWIPTRPDLDPARVMVTGGSYGGYMTLAVATHYSDRIRCAVDVVGVSNFVTFLEQTESYRRDLRRAEYGDERDPKMREFLLSIAPTRNAAKIRKPLFVIQGQNDPRVPMAESERIVATVKANGTPVWYLLAKDEGHGFAKKKNADFQFYATLAFMDAFLLD